MVAGVAGLAAHRGTDRETEQAGRNITTEAVVVPMSSIEALVLAVAPLAAVRAPIVALRRIRVAIAVIPDVAALLPIALMPGSR